MFNLFLFPCYCNKLFAINNEKGRRRASEGEREIERKRGEWWKSKYTHREHNTQISWILCY